MSNINQQLHREIFNRKLFEHVRDLREGDVHGEADGLNALFKLEAKTFDIENLEAWCESPIELMLGAGLSWAIDGYKHFELLSPDLYELLNTQSAQGKLEGTVGTFFAPQVAIENYRVDFLGATCCHGLLNFTAIECDGHDYHERTKGQASRDKKRDRALLSLGIPTLRFTGSDIHYKLEECIEEIEGFLFNRMEDLMVKNGSARPNRKGQAA